MEIWLVMKYKYFKQYKIKDMYHLVKNGFAKPKVCHIKANGKTILITGATSGIGYATAHLYARNGADLVFINRSETKSRDLCEELSREYQAKCSYIIADYAELSQIKKAAEQLRDSERCIDIIIHNAGIYLEKKAFSKDGIELVFQVNHLGAFILNAFLMEKWKAQNKARIIYVNSEGHRFALSGIHLDDLDWVNHRYSGLRSYGAAKTAQLLTMMMFKDYFAESNVKINAMHPGAVKTHMGKENSRSYRLFKQLFIDPLSDSATISAQALYYLGISDEVADISGKFFNLTTLEKPAPHAMDKDAAELLWEKSLELSGL